MTHSADHAAGVGAAAREPSAVDNALASRATSRRLKWAFVLVPVAIILVGGWLHRWVADDAFIDFRVVRNVLEGHGPVFNVGERVETYTDPLWVAMLVVTHGVLRFISIEWCSVFLGLALTGFGVLLGGLGALRLGARHSTRVVIPVGMLCASVVPAMWDFATSGLETGLIFAWLGLTWWLTLQCLDRKSGVHVAAVVASLGFTIRPDMLIFTVTFGIALAFLAAARATAASRGVARPLCTLGAALVAIPVLSELFRVAYFGMLVSNTALAKSAFSTRWEQGWSYLVDFLHPYWLVVPIFLIVLALAYRTLMMWHKGDRTDAVVMLAPAIGGALSALYVVAIGGDFMHARMLLPAFFAWCLTFWLDPANALEVRAPITITCVWAALCLTTFRYTEPWIGQSGIANERSFWVISAGNAHPITLADFKASRYYLLGELYRSAASSVPAGSKEVVAGFRPGTFEVATVAGTSRLPESLIAPSDNIGVTGLEAGVNVYIFDMLSLANPIGTHFVLTQRGRPGHDDMTSPAWMFGRFGVPGDQLPSNALNPLAYDLRYLDHPPPGQGSAVENEMIAAARSAISCQPLSGYLHGITAPLGLSQVVANFEHAFTWTTMKFSSDPVAAEAQLCG